MRIRSKIRKDDVRISVVGLVVLNAFSECPRGDGSLISQLKFQTALPTQRADITIDFLEAGISRMLKNCDSTLRKFDSILISKLVQGARRAKD